MLQGNIGDDALCDKLKNYVDADVGIQDVVRAEVLDGETDLITAILRSEVIQPRLDGKQIVRIHTALLAWNSAIDAVRLASVRWS